MKKSYKIIGAMLLCIAMCVSVVQANKLRPLDRSGQAKYGATHVWEIEYSDLTTATTNTAQTLTAPVSANRGVTFVAFELPVAFDTENTNYTGSLTLTVGDGTDADLYLTSTELASDGTEVLVKLANSNGGTVAITPQTTDVETDPVLTVSSFDITYDSDGSGTMATNSVVTNVTVATTTSTVATNATAVFTTGVLGEKVYTAADTIDAVFTPNSEESVSENEQGRVRLYLKIFP